MFFDTNKNTLLIILISISIFLLTSVSFIFYLVPHYDEKGEYKLFGEYYDTKHILQLKTNQSKNKKLINIIDSQKNKNISLQQKFQNLSQTTQNLKLLEKENKNLKNNIDLLKSKLDQQQQFIQTQNIEHKQENKQKQFIKKRQFSNVSKNNITNERPQLGNMYSKSLKKTTTTST